MRPDSFRGTDPDLRGSNVKLFKRFTRIGLIAVVAVLAFGAGLALRDRGDDRSTVAPEAVAPVGADRTFRPIRLVRAAPGALRRPAPERSPEPSGAPAAASPAVSAPAAAIPAPPAAAPAPSPEESPAPPETEPRDPPDQPSPANTGFDSEG
jgi:hypothetical protein